MTAMDVHRAVARNCPDWCANPHVEGETFHYQEAVKVDTENVGKVAISISWDERTNRALVTSGEDEYTAEQAKYASRVLAAAADLIETIRG